ncbi:uncharacterized protein LOC116846880 isoform X2 [Odontomachus brunneus]|uniref:uncharacterized protein LOC116846880 isoform X2 n=1 Tax=Odontomachus brunneus TaxID=486640 RepID=UPI0013F277E2|nr:uncharacterized protein LOC116846880 isoform X2 [Odontomachus brunneus]
MCASNTSIECYTTTQYRDCDEFYNPNICHVCKSVTDFIVTCRKCCMIIYCNRHHERLHEKQHMDMCKSLRCILDNYNEFFDPTRRFSQKEWIESRKQLMKIVKHELLRNLKPYEKQMILFPKSCLICHQQDKPVDDMNSFILQYIRTEKNVNIWDAEDYYCSDYVSGPLTLYYKMEYSNLLHIFGEKSSICVVHIIAASSVDKKYVSAWEILLHLLDEIKHLKLVMIGMELNNECYITNYIKVCCRCKSIHKKFSFESHRMLYHTYVNSEYYIRPNIILGFQTDFSDVEMWSASLVELRDQDCPFLVTAKSKIKSDQNISNIERVLGEFLNLIHNDENQFSSSMPCRDFVDNDSVFYRNKYVAIFFNLYPLMWSFC